MFCPNCYSQVPDDVSVCPFCKVDISKKRFKVNIPEENIADVFSSLPKKNDEAVDAFDKTEEADGFGFGAQTSAALEENGEELHGEYYENEEYSGEEYAGEEYPDGEYHGEEYADEEYSDEEYGGEEFADAEQQEGFEESAPEAESDGDVRVADVIKNENVVVHAVPKPDPERERKEKRARTVLFSLVCVCAVAMFVLTYVGRKTDVFKVPTNQVKTVALSGFSQSERSSFEDYAVFFPALNSNEYDSKNVNKNDLLALMKPETASGLYAAFYQPAEVIKTEADPANRFSQPDDGYLYCKIKKDEIQNICVGLGVDVPDYANTGEFYYYDGFYYFAATADKAAEASKYSVAVDSSKRTGDGNYYVECTLTSPQGKQQAAYCLVSLSKQDGENSWSLLELSSEKLFDDNGTKVQTVSKNGLTFEMKKETYEAKTGSGVHYADFIVEYPYFTGSEDDETAKAAASTLNALFADKLLKFKEKSEKADRLYKRYKRRGYSDDDLPLYTYSYTKVTYNDNGYISLLEETNEYMPKKADAQEPATTEAQAQTETSQTQTEQSLPQTNIVFPTTTFDGYTLEIKRCELLKRTDILGKDHQATEQKLYEIYYKASHEPDETTGEYVIPVDAENIGQQIYSSAWCLEDNGVLFKFSNSDGISQGVLLLFTETDGEVKL